MALALGIHLVVTALPMWWLHDDNADWSEDTPWFPGVKDSTLPTFNDYDAAAYIHYIAAVILLITISDACDMIFVNSLNFATQKAEKGMKGALFLAIGSSAPELFTSVAGLWTEIDAITSRCDDPSVRVTFCTNQTTLWNASGLATSCPDEAYDWCLNEQRTSAGGATIGMSTIAGSAIVNILIVMACCAWAVKDTPGPRQLPQPLEKPAIERDITFYAISIVLMLTFFLNSYPSGTFKLTFINVSMLAVLYILYVIRCSKDGQRLNNQRLRQSVKNHLRLLYQYEMVGVPTKDNLGLDHSYKFTTQWAKYGEVELTTYSILEFIVFGAIVPVWFLRPFVVNFLLVTTYMFPLFIPVDNSTDESDTQQNNEKQIFESWGKLKPPQTIKGGVHDANNLKPPSSIKGGVHDALRDQSYEQFNEVDKEDWKMARGWWHKTDITYKNKYIAWAILSCVFGLLLLGIFSYMLVAIVGHWGENYGIPIEFLGVTILALGTSIPDIAGSVAAMKESGANEAIGSAYGSNTFDICVGLGIVYWFKLLLVDYLYLGAYGRKHQNLGILDVYINIGSTHWTYDAQNPSIDAGSVMLQSFLVILLVILFSWRLLCQQPVTENRRMVTIYKENIAYRWQNSLWIIKKNVISQFIVPCVLGYVFYVIYFACVVFVKDGQGSEDSWYYWIITAFPLALGTIILINLPGQPWENACCRKSSVYNKEDIPGYGYVSKNPSKAQREFANLGWGEDSKRWAGKFKDYKLAP